MNKSRSLGIFSTNNQILPLTGIRFIAAALVLYTHYLVWVSPIKSEQLSFLQGDTSRYGMTLFFVLSGFVIHLTYSSLFKNQSLSRATFLFFVARFARLYPLYLFFIGFYLVRTLGTLHRFVADPEFQVYVLLHVLGIQSWLPFTMDGAISSNGPFNVSWSISTEMFFYLVYPFIFLVVVKFNTVSKSLKLFGCFLLLAYVFLWLVMRNLDLLSQPLAILVQGSYKGGGDSSGHWLEYISPYVRLPEFICGVIAAQIYSTVVSVRFSARNIVLIRRWAYVMFPLAWLCLLSFQHGNPFAVFLSKNFLMAPLIAVFLVYVAIDSRNAFSRCLSVWPFFVLGEVSYSIYLLHPAMPRLIDIPSNAYDLSFSSVLLFIVSLMLLLGLLASLAIGMYLLWEKPARNMIRKLAGGWMKPQSEAPFSL